MRLPFAHTSPTLVESPPDAGLFFVSLFVVVMTLRYSVRIARSSLEGRNDWKSLIRLVAICTIAGFAALARFALIFYEWAKISDVFGFEPMYPLSSLSQFGVAWIYVTLTVSGVGLAVAFVSSYSGTIEKTVWARFLIRNRWKLLCPVVAAFVLLLGYRTGLKPVLNEASLLEQLEGSNGVDAYRSPKEIRLYSVRNDFGREHYLYPKNPEEELVRADEYREWSRVQTRYYGYKLGATYELLDADSVKESLRKLFVFKSRTFDAKNAKYLLRFVGDSSVLDIWLSDREEIEIFSSKLLSDYDASLGFTLPYLVVMEQSVGRGLKYDAGRGHYVERFVDRIRRIDRSQ